MSKMRKQSPERTCSWTPVDCRSDIWETSCGKDVALDDTPQEYGMCYCCYCGGRLNGIAYQGNEKCEARRTTPDREAIIEECAKVRDEDAYDKWNLYKGQHPYTGRESGRADPYVEGRADGASVCADRIRALKTVPTSDKGGA